MRHWGPSRRGFGHRRNRGRRRSRCLGSFGCGRGRCGSGGRDRRRVATRSSAARRGNHSLRRSRFRSRSRFRCRCRCGCRSTCLNRNRRNFDDGLWGNRRNRSFGLGRFCRVFGGSVLCRSFFRCSGLLCRSLLRRGLLGSGLFGGSFRFLRLHIANQAFALSLAANAICLGFNDA